MIRLNLDTPAFARLDLSAQPLGPIAIGDPVVRLDLSPRPLGLVSLPLFPPVLTDDFLQAGSAFLEAGTETLSW